MVSEPTLSRAQRYFFPSIVDLLFAGILLTRLGPSLFNDGDTGWQTKTIRRRGGEGMRLTPLPQGRKKRKWNANKFSRAGNEFPVSRVIAPDLQGVARILTPLRSELMIKKFPRANV